MPCLLSVLHVQSVIIYWMSRFDPLIREQKQPTERERAMNSFHAMYGYFVCIVSVNTRQRINPLGVKCPSGTDHTSVRRNVTS